MPSPRTRTPRAGNPAHRASARALPIVNETSAGGLVVDVQNGQAFTAVIARRNRGGRLEWCLPKGHLEGTETPEQQQRRLRTAARELEARSEFDEVVVNGELDETVDRLVQLMRL